MFSRLFPFVVALTLIGLSTTARAELMLTIKDGQLVSAWGVEVDGYGTLDVEFVDGTCVEVFSGCDEPSDFYFGGDSAGAAAASQALLDQVLIDTTEGLFDTDPEATAGCASDILCSVMTSFSLIPSRVSVVVTSNSDPLGSDSIFFSSHDRTAGTARSVVWAVWSATATQVPEPASVFLFLFGLAGLGWVSRRRLLPVS